MCKKLDLWKQRWWNNGCHVINTVLIVYDPFLYLSLNCWVIFENLLHFNIWIMILPGFLDFEQKTSTNTKFRRPDFLSVCGSIISSYTLCLYIKLLTKFEFIISWLEKSLILGQWQSLLCNLSLQCLKSLQQSLLYYIFSYILCIIKIFYATP